MRRGAAMLPSGLGRTVRPDPPARWHTRRERGGKGRCCSELAAPALAAARPRRGAERRREGDHTDQHAGGDQPDADLELPPVAQPGAGGDGCSGHGGRAVRVPGAEARVLVTRVEDRAAEDVGADAKADGDDHDEQEVDSSSHASECRASAVRRRRAAAAPPLQSAAVAGERVKLRVRPRERLGSAETRRLRREGVIPGVLYGRGEPQAICVPERELRTALTGAGGLHAILDVVVEGAAAPHPSVLKDMQKHAVRGTATHIDLHEVRLDQPIQATVVVELVGEAAGASEGGVLSLVTREVTVEALPMEIPEHLELDVSGLGIGDSARVGDLSVPEGVTLVDDPEMVVANVSLPTRVEEPEEMLDAAEEGLDLPEGERPEGGSEAPADPGADAAGEHRPIDG